MDEVLELCVRVLGDGPAAAEAAEAASGAGDRISALRAAVTACRERAAEPPPDAAPAGEGAGLAVAVARELEQATATLPESQREVLALRELLRLPYADIAAVTGSAPEQIGSLLAEARLGLRDARRGPLPVQPGPCDEPARALRLLAARQDGEALSAGEEEWLHAHLMSCPECEIAHAAMLEATLCYRGWRTS